MGVRILSVAAALLLASLAVPTAAAAPACAAVTETAAVAAASAYILPSGAGAQVWTEWNQAPGLQRASCVDGAGQTVPPDAYWATVGAGTPFEVVRAIEEGTGCQIGVPVRCFG